MSDDVKINRGLKGVYFERSGVSDIDGRAGSLTYRGYSIHDLATHATFEEVSYLLIHGELPNAAELAAYDAHLKAARALPAPIYDIIRCCAGGHPMDVLRTVPVFVTYVLTAMWGVMFFARRCSTWAATS